MIDEITNLEQIARQLEPSAEERENMLGKVTAYAEDFLSKIYELPAYRKSDDNGSGIYDFPLKDEPVDIETLIDSMKEHVDLPGINPASGGHLGYIPGGGIFHSALGDYLADIMNKYAGVFFAGPGTVRLQNMLIRWMNDLVGYPGSAAGNLTSGGSISNLIGIVTGRDAIGLKAKDYENSVIYVTEQAHHSVNKSVRIAGLNECIIRKIPMDDAFRMDFSALETAVESDKHGRLRPWLVVSSAGTTDTGSVDPLGAIGDLCSANEMWHHVDGAYGAFFLLSDIAKDKLAGIGKSDSVVMDPHKGLFLPYGTGAVLVHDKEKMYNSHYYFANYMQDANNDQQELSPADLSPELSTHFRSLRLWFPLMLCGLKPFKAALDEKILLTRYFHEKIREVDGFEVGPYPELSVSTFRYVPERGDANEFNARIIEEIHNDGRVFISSTMIDGKFTLRLAVLHFRTHKDTVDLTIEALKEAVVKIKAAF